MPTGVYTRKRRDYSGLKVNDWLVIKFSRVHKKNHLWWCRCKCGVEKEVIIGSIICGNTKSCGCDLKYDYLVKHGLCNHPLYPIFNKIKSRCNNKNDKAFHLYGGRGIKCLWSKTQDFIDDMYEDYKIHKSQNSNNGIKQNTTIERIDNDGNYCKENCRWATRKEQANNTRWNLKNRVVNKVQVG